MERSKWQRALIIVSLIFAGETIFTLPYHVTRFFRPTFLEVFELSATELGLAQSAYGFIAMAAYFFGGPLADRFEPRKLLAGSLWATALGGLYLATFPDVTGVMLVWGFFGLTNILLFWAALIKVTRAWGGVDQQGLAYGLLDGGRGLPISLSILWSGFDKKYSNFLWGFSLILISHYWLLYLHPLTWLGFSWITSILISNIILIFCSLLGGFYVILWGLIGSKIISKNDIFSQKDSFVFTRITLISLCWAFGEVFISQTSFFWIGIGESLIPGDLYLAGLARLIGSPGVCFIVILFGFWIFLIFERWKRKLNFKKVFFAGILSVFCLHLIGGYLIQPDNVHKSLYPIAIWQTNIPTREKLLQ